MAEVKTTTVKSPNNAPRSTTGRPKRANHFWLNFLIVLACIAVAWLIWHFVFGNPSNFQDAEKHMPAAGFKGVLGAMHVSYIIPFLVAMLLVLIIFVIERALAIGKAKGKTDGSEFIRKVQYHLANKNVDAAIAECDKQSGSVGNVMKSGLLKYRDMIHNSTLTTDEKVIAINAEIEEAQALEMPMLDKNMVFLSTITSAATLLGLLGTVVGMIAAFQAMANTGAPDATALAAGISEALYNTALGIGTSFIAMIAYNYFSSAIEGIKYNIDETGFTLGHTFAEHYK